MLANLAPRRNFILAVPGRLTIFLGRYLSFSKSSELAVDLTTASIPLFRDQYQPNLCDLGEDKVHIGRLRRCRALISTFL
jgi:hypothetical protein